MVVLMVFSLFPCGCVLLFWKAKHNNGTSENPPSFWYQGFMFATVQLGLGLSAERPLGCHCSCTSLSPACKASGDDVAGTKYPLPNTHSATLGEPSAIMSFLAFLVPKLIELLAYCWLFIFVRFFFHFF